MTPSKFSPRDAQVRDLVDRFPLAWIVVEHDGRFVTSVMPLLAEADGNGRLVALFGHIPLAHPQVALIRSQPRALVLFQGPDAYISPAAVAKTGWAPTWNFTVAAFTVDIELVPDETDRALSDLVAHMERGRDAPWTVERMGPRYAELARHVVAFRAVIRDVEARFKHGQDEDAAVFTDILRHLGHHPLAAAMRDTRRDEDILP